MIDWLAFLTVLGASIVSGVVVVTLFALGLRLVAADGSRDEGGKARTGNWHRPVGIASFVVCGLVILYGVYLIIPALHR
jgi:hypothetical protein